MIRLSLPAYDPKRPLAIRVIGHLQNFAGPGFVGHANIRLWAGGFAGNVVRDLPLIAEAGTGMVPAHGDVVFDPPDAHGLTGAEGWFAVEPSQLMTGYVYIHDVIVSYTPPGADTTRAEGHFS